MPPRRSISRAGTRGTILRIAGLFAIGACAAGATESVFPLKSNIYTVNHARLPGGGASEIHVAEGRIAATGSEGAPAVDAGGAFVVPAFIDSHVHLAYLPDRGGMRRGGVAAAVDLGAPLRALGRLGDIPTLAAGPLLTAPGGYPLDSWGRGGYGLPVSTAAEATRAVEELRAAGAGLLKLALAPGPRPPEAALRAAVEAARHLGWRVAVHALTDADAALAARLGADVLAHTPVAPLSDDTVGAWSGRAVISTLAAFGASRSAIENLRRLRAAGATVLYGTDYGNTRSPGIDPLEIAALSAAGLDGAALVAAGTSAPRAFWGGFEAGSLEPGAAASFLLLDADPHAEPAALARPSRVVIDGELVR
jgi:imidazolonepropionase-like amidohydrolase